MRHLFLLAVLLYACTSYAQIRVQERLSEGETSFVLTTPELQAKIYYDVNDELVIKKSAELFAFDVERVTGRKPEWRKRGKSIYARCKGLGNDI